MKVIGTCAVAPGATGPNRGTAGSTVTAAGKSMARLPLTAWGKLFLSVTVIVRPSSQANRTTSGTNANGKGHSAAAGAGWAAAGNLPKVK